MRLCACAALLLALAHAALAQYAYEDGVDFYDDYSLYNAGYDAYQEEEDSFYANEYMGPYDEPYDDFGLEEREDLRADCRIGADGTPQFNGAYPRPADAAAPAAFVSRSSTCPPFLFCGLPELGFWGPGTRPCDVKLEGVDKLLKGTPGGLDGVYAVASCENGRPLYKRQGSAAGRACPANCACARTFKCASCGRQMRGCPSICDYVSVLRLHSFNISSLEKRNMLAFRQNSHCALNALPLTAYSI